ncbi:hypothetical protein LTR70_002317 [Exophiala xenobiotica]|uniref:DUF7082 domain-containing protein n=1 Tax=Lithohypha guttulata TaxID=1690604 RepID=A0ABR0KL44_9EURO|nr:hypothetical protein LTR24_001261 [Lithohypha guttulata]KAK5326052.1 hypothetical protein LTR70_002317 [Exophiala xenobiotica]
MSYQDGFQVVEDVEQLQFFGGFGADDLMAAMSGYGKQQPYDVFSGMDFNHGSGLQYLPSSYDSPVTNQNDLAALPNGCGGEYDDSFVYAPSQATEYPRTTVASTMSGRYSTVPSTAPAQVHGQAPVYNTASPSKKRKASVESFHGEAPAPKRVAVGITDPSGEFYDFKSEPSPYTSTVPTPTTMSTYHMPYSLVRSPRLPGHQHSTSNASQISVTATAPYTPTISPSFTTTNTEHSPHAPATPSVRPASVGSNPRLVRTSTIPQHSPQAIPSSMSLVGHTQTFNPYTLYSPDSKARLHLDGNLDDVAKDWSDKELEARRKIIVFNREQKGNDIYANFEVVSQEEWKNHPRSVSCIWWAEKKEAYVTSVDTILLLEGIVAARFTVEEKNRIRRNLEGFKPDTVSKAKPETEEFFKVIMGFPNPKPRNIEKDVKVFPWKILSIALQKIISKYSASYASTAASINNQPKMFRPAERHEYPYATSPGSEYHSGMQMASFPIYEPQGRMSAPATPAPPMHLMPQMAQYEAHPNYGYGHVHIPSHHQHMQYQSQPMTAPISAPAQYWQHAGYPTEGPMPMAPSSAPPYPCEMMDPASYRSAQLGYPIHAGHH